MNQHIAHAATMLKTKFEALENKRDILKAPELRELYGRIKDVPADERAAFGQAVNELKEEIEALVAGHEAAAESAAVTPIDVTAPFDVNVAPADRPKLLPTEHGSRHPLSTERQVVADIFARMGYKVLDSRQIDDDYHMFGSLNFPEGHPARDDYDTFVTEEGLIAPAHTSTMQNRVLKAGTPPIATVVIGRVFRNEDLDPKHEHTLNQIEGVYVGKGVNVGHLLATLQSFLQSYYKTDINFRIQPAYFPFVEPGFEFAISCPFCDQKGCATCKYEGWIELLGCGMIHPNVLLEGGIDPKEYTGFAWGLGLDRLAMMKHDIEDIRHFQSGKLDFLRQFKV
ncbi:MAG TPA: phenylalanine--tRNA ligase subunit alpha [Magnetospirillaceae bacterium]|nr:phenylalanine--tRNA ligase subunit alpha [Magnetospirillaceae bacterium]